MCFVRPTNTLIFISAQKWHRIEPMPTYGGQRYLSGAVVMNDAIYVVGGKDSKLNNQDDAVMFNPLTMKWEGAECWTSQTFVPRDSFGIAVIQKEDSGQDDDEAYVVGGEDQYDQRLRLVSSFCCRSGGGGTRKHPEMNEARDNCGAATIGTFVYAIGGGSDNEMHSSIEKFDTSARSKFDRKWTKCASMNVPRCGFGTAVLDGKIYVIGGLNVERKPWIAMKYLADVEVYDPKKDEWTVLPSMSEARYNLGAVAIEGKIYAVGGTTAFGEALNSVECYDPKTKRWSFLPPMLEPRDGCAVAAM